jgi:hypothetical protein
VANSDISAVPCELAVVVLKLRVTPIVCCEGQCGGQQIGEQAITVIVRRM